MTTYALLIAWVTLFSLRILFGGEGGTLDQAVLWTLRVLTLVIAIRLLVSVFYFVKNLVSDAKQSKQVFTDKRIRIILIGGLVLGLFCRTLTWGSGGQGVAGWTGAILVCLSLIGLGLLYIRRAHGLDRTAKLSYWHPYCRAALFAAWVVSLVALGAARPTGAIGGILVALFWLSLVALVIQVLGDRLHRFHGHR